MLAQTFALLSLLAPAVLGHFEGTREEHAARDHFQEHTTRSYAANCMTGLSRRQHLDRAYERRVKWANELRAARGKRALNRRELASVSASHLSNATGLTADSDPFSAISSGCVLDPDVTQGPYWVSDELIRSNVTDGEPGVPLYADIEVVDVSTCTTLSGLYLDFWHANSSGVYSGVVANGNGDGSSSNLNNTALRGVQITNSEGYAQFESVFPGHYSGRAVHIHVMVHQTDGTVNSNGTYTGSTASHVGQMFFDQDLISEVSAVSPYSSNTQSLTLNSADNIMSSVTDTIDPVMHYVLLGDSIEDGILAWTTLVIDTSASETVSAAATWTEDGGVSNSGSGSGGSGGAAGGGSAPSASASGRGGSAGVSGSASAARQSGSSTGVALVASASSSASGGDSVISVPSVVAFLGAVAAAFGIA